MKLPLLLAAPLLLILASCTGGDNGTPPTATLPPEISPVAQLFEPTLRAVPEAGGCESFELRGTGYEPGGAVWVMRFDVDTLEWVDINPVGPSLAGNFSFRVDSSLLESCHPGFEHTFATRTSASLVPVRVVYRIEQLGPLTVSPSAARCSGELMIQGGGFPPGAEVLLLLGDADPGAHVFVQLGTALASPAGQVEYRYLPPEGLSHCPPPATGLTPPFEKIVRAWVPGVTALWMAEFTYVP